MLDKKSVMKNVALYAQEVKKIMNPNSIILFGSYVNGTPNDESDIDIAVIFNGIDGDRWGISSQLWELTCKIDDRIEPILLDNTKDSSGFVAEVYKTGQIIYRA